MQDREQGRADPAQSKSERTTADELAVLDDGRRVLDERDGYRRYLEGVL